MGLILDLVTAATISHRQQPPAQTTVPVVYDPVYAVRPGVYVGAGPGRLSGRRMLRAERVAYLSQAMAPSAAPLAPTQPCPGRYYAPPEHHSQDFQPQSSGRMEYTCQGPTDSWRDFNQLPPPPQQQQQQQQQWARGGIEYASRENPVRMEAQQSGGEPPVYEPVAKKN